jgi:hypothetical protein
MIEQVRSLNNRIGRSRNRDTEQLGGFESVEVLPSKRYRSGMIRLVRSLNNRVLLKPEIAILGSFVNSNE